MQNEIHMFTAQATASEKNDHYTDKSRHALLVFIRQPVGTEYDRENARKTVEDTGWENIVIGKAGKLALKPDTNDETLKHAYLDAAETGSSIVVYAEPIEDS